MCEELSTRAGTATRAPHLGFLPPLEFDIERANQQCLERHLIGRRSDACLFEHGARESDGGLRHRFSARRLGARWHATSCVLRVHDCAIAPCAVGCPWCARNGIVVKGAMLR